jgi:hypothetical protein
MTSAYTRIAIPGYRVSRREGDRVVVRTVPAHVVLLSVPWTRRGGLRGDPVGRILRPCDRAGSTRRRRSEVLIS